MKQIDKLVENHIFLIKTEDFISAQELKMSLNVLSKPMKNLLMKRDKSDKITPMQ